MGSARFGVVTHAQGAGLEVRGLLDTSILESTSGLGLYTYAPLLIEWHATLQLPWWNGDDVYESTVVRAVDEGQNQGRPREVNFIPNKPLPTPINITSSTT